MRKRRASVILLSFFLLVVTTAHFVDDISSAAEPEYDIVLLNGRVIDPESKLDGIRNIGISNGIVQEISAKSLKGRTTLLCTGLVVAPGFIDLHEHGQTPDAYEFQVTDGVTTSLELEVGTADVDRWYAEREGKTIVNYGVSIGHIPVRMAVMHDPGSFLPIGDAAKRAATDGEIEELKRRIEQGLKRGAVAVGFGVAYTAAASYWEILEMFRVAARLGASCHVHIRGPATGDAEREPGLMEVIAAATISGAPLHVVHIQSSGLQSTPRLLQLIGEARSRGLDVTTECYPYTAGATGIESALFDGWENRPESYFQTLQWAATGERLSRASFERYRKAGGIVIIHSNTEEVVSAAVVSPLTMIASDGILQNGKGHPRGSGTYARVLGRYVRESKALSLVDALRKMTIMPAQRLERRVPMMKNKGRIRVGADADLTIFDPQTVIDKSTYEEPAKYSAGIKHVLVNGVFVVKDGQLQRGAMPGRAVRAPVSSR